jgi:ribosomal protein S27E
MSFSELKLVRMYCPNCGHKCAGYKSREQTARIRCERCGATMSSKKIDGRTVDTRMVVPPKQGLFF